MNKKINPTVNYTQLIILLNQVTKKVSKYMDSPVNFAILFGDGAYDEVMFCIEYKGTDFEYTVNAPVSDLIEVLNEFGVEKFLNCLSNTLINESMKEFFNFSINNS